MISHETSLYLTQRDFATGTTSLFTFLNYGGPAQLKDIIQHFFFQGSLFLSSTGKFNSTVYIGLLPLVFFVWSLLKVRNILFLAFLSVLISVFWFSFGGFFSAGVYFFPAMHLYRHIGFVYGIIKILILICAGFGLDYFWKVRAREKLGYFFIILAVFVFVFDVLSISRYVLISLLDPPVVEKLKAMNLMPEGLREFIPTVGRYFLSFSFLFIMAVITNFISKKKGIGREKKDSFIYGLIVLSLTIPFCLDLFSFQWTAYHNAPKFLRTNQILLESVEVNQPQFQEARVLEPFLERQKKAQKLMRRKEGFGGPYQQDSNFIQIDRCMVVDQSKAYFLSERVDRLLKISNPSNPSFRKILGWHHPKLRLVSRAAFCDTIEDARKQIQEHHDLENTVILRGVDERTRSTANSKSNSEIRQNIKVIKFSSNEITIETNVVDEAGAWLVYADAFHPGWHATVNGKKVNIYEAYLAFKAVHVGKGKSLVRFFFYDGLRSSLNIFIFMFCLVMSIVFVFVFLEILIFDMKHIEFLLDRISNKS
ncbi:MAG: YfhO family protein [Candidatus Aceula meridiana]|nr:YfhO family protein [Candidatus Aceula meridiana]